MNSWKLLVLLSFCMLVVACGPTDSVSPEQTSESPGMETATQKEPVVDRAEVATQNEPVAPDTAEPTAEQAGSADAGESIRPDTIDAGEQTQPEAPITEEQPEVPAPTKMGAAIDDAMTAEMTKQKLVGLAVGVVKDGKVAYTKGYGYADRELKVPVVASQTMFRWASISKTLAGVVATQMVSQQKLDLDLPIQIYVTDYKVPTEYLVTCKGDSVTVKGKTYPCKQQRALIPLEVSQRKVTSRWLAGHLAGIPHYTNGSGNPTPPISETNDAAVNTGIAWAVKKYLYPKPLLNIPGSKYNYSTFGFNLLGVVLEQAAGVSFATLVQDRITKPASMTTLQPDYEWKSISHRAVGYVMVGSSIARQGSSDVSWKLPGGGFISTVQDMTLYCQALLGTKLLSAAEKTLAWSRQKTTSGGSINYGIGFGIGSRNNRDYIGHSGSQQKTLTQLRLYPKEGLCVVIMTNATYANSSTLRNLLEDTVRKF